MTVVRGGLGSRTSLLNKMCMWDFVAESNERFNYRDGIVVIVIRKYGKCLSVPGRISFPRNFDQSSFNCV